MPKLEELAPLDAKSIGILYRNLNHWGFKKSMISFSQVDLIYRCLGISISVGENMYLFPSEYVTIIQAIYDLYRWGKYDDEDECVWLLHRIKSDAFHRLRNQCYGRLSYLSLVEAVKVHKDTFGLKINTLVL